jgi:hypothetical protein
MRGPAREGDGEGEGEGKGERVTERTEEREEGRGSKGERDLSAVLKAHVTDVLSDV